MSAVGRLDRYQRRHTWLGLPLAVIYKFFDDRGSYLSALVAYYSFVSLFPLLLLFWSALGFFLQGDPSLQTSFEHSVLTHLPGVGRSLTSHLSTFRGSGIGLAVGILGTLYGALGAMQAAQAGFNQIYGVPRNKQPNPIKSRVRSLGLLALLGAGILLSIALAITLSTAGRSLQLNTSVRVVGYILTYLLNVALFSTAFQLLTASDLRFREVVEGGIVAAALWTLLQAFGSAFVSHTLANSQHFYGFFAVVLATLAWLYLQSVILMLSAEINVVVHNRLWPRSLLTPFTDNVVLTEADRRVYRGYAQVQRFKGFETVTAEFGVAESPPPSDDGGGPPEVAEAPAGAGRRRGGLFRRRRD